MHVTGLTGKSFGMFLGFMALRGSCQKELKPFYRDTSVSMRKEGEIGGSFAAGSNVSMVVNYFYGWLYEEDEN